LRRRGPSSDRSGPKIWPDRAWPTMAQPRYAPRSSTAHAHAHATRDTHTHRPHTHAHVAPHTHNSCSLHNNHQHDQQNIESILDKGLLVPGKGKGKDVSHATDTGFWGGGIYLSPNSSMSVGYCRGTLATACTHHTRRWLDARLHNARTHARTHTHRREEAVDLQRADGQDVPVHHPYPRRRPHGRL